MKSNKKTAQIGVYLLFLLISFVIALVLWFFLVDGKLFYCSDSVPFLDFIPPFVHGKQVGDYFIVSPFIVYLVWFVFLFAIFLTPAYLTRKYLAKRIRDEVLQKQHKHDEKNK